MNKNGTEYTWKKKAPHCGCKSQADHDRLYPHRVGSPCCEFHTGKKIYFLDAWRPAGVQGENPIRKMGFPEVSYD